MHLTDKAFLNNLTSFAKNLTLTLKNRMQRVAVMIFVRKIIVGVLLLAERNRKLAVMSSAQLDQNKYWER